MVGTSSPVSSWRSRMVTPVHFHDLEHHVHHVAEQPVQLELAGELLGHLQQHGKLLGLPLLSRGGRHPELPDGERPVAAGDAGGATRAHHELADDGVAEGSLGCRGDPLGKRGPALDPLAEEHLAEGDRVVAVSRPVVTRLPLIQVPLELPRSCTWTPSPRAVSSAWRREMVGS